jgi:hypothetical protein
VAARTARRSRPDRQAPRRPRHPDRTGHAHPGRPRRTPPPARRTAARRPRRTAVPFAAQVAQVVGIAELEYLGLAADRVGELAAQPGTSSRQEPVPGRPATPRCTGLLTVSTVPGAAAKPRQPPQGPPVMAPRGSSAAALSERWGRRPRPRTVPTPPGPSAGPVTAPPRGCVRARGRHRPAQGSGAPSQHRVSGSIPDGCPLCRSPFCPTFALLLPDRGRAGFGRWTCILSARPGGWGGVRVGVACRGAVPNRSATGAGARARPPGGAGPMTSTGAFGPSPPGTPRTPAAFLPSHRVVAERPCRCSTAPATSTEP